MATTLIVNTYDGYFYTVPASGTKPIADEAKDHGELNDHIKSIETPSGKTLWERLNQ